MHATHLTAPTSPARRHPAPTACICPTTERDLADGIGPARALRDAGVPLCLGSDQHAVIDLLEEARALELHERLATGERGRFTPAELLAALTAHAHARAGRTPGGSPSARGPTWSRSGSTRSARRAPTRRRSLFAATAADVDTVVVDGAPVVQGGGHRLGDVGALLPPRSSPS